MAATGKRPKKRDSKAILNLLDRLRQGITNAPKPVTSVASIKRPRSNKNQSRQLIPIIKTTE